MRGAYKACTTYVRAPGFRASGIGCWSGSKVLFSTLEDTCSRRLGFESGAVVTIAATIHSRTAAKTAGSISNLN